MFTDITDIATFTLEQINNNKINDNSCMHIYDVYRELFNLYEEQKLITSFLLREIDHSDIETSFGTPTKKWLYFCNHKIAEYENIKYSLFCKISKLYNNYLERKVILATNFFSKSLNCHIDEYTEIAKIDDDLQFIYYQFNLKKDNCKMYRSFDELFERKIVNIKSNKDKHLFITKLNQQNIEYYEMLKEFEQLIQNRCSVQDLFCKRRVF